MKEAVIVDCHRALSAKQERLNECRAAAHKMMDFEMSVGLAEQVDRILAATSEKEESVDR